MPGHEALILGARLNRDGCGHFFEARGDHKLFLKCQLQSTSPVAGLKLTSFSNWRTARLIQFHATYSTPVPSLRQASFSNWQTARSIQFDVTYPTPVYTLKLTSLSNWRTARPIQIDVTFLPLFLV